MSEKRTIFCHGRHDIHKPHLAVPSGFSPLRMRVEGGGMEVEVTCPVASVGRHTDSDLRLGFADVSRHHCQFVFESGVWRVFDLRSLNGIYVNNRRTAEATLFEGDLVRIGCVTLLVLAATPAPEKAHEKLRQIVDVLPE